jgi:hypothetical protein
VTDPTRRIAPRSAVAVADTRLLRAARTDLVSDASTPSIIDRLRSRLPGARRG